VVQKCSFADLKIFFGHWAWIDDRDRIDPIFIANVWYGQDICYLMSDKESYGSSISMMSVLHRIALGKKQSKKSGNPNFAEVLLIAF